MVQSGKKWIISWSCSPCWEQYEHGTGDK